MFHAPMPLRIPTMIDLRPVPDAPALRLASARRSAPVDLIVSDVHLGLGATRARPSGPPEASSARIADLVIGWARTARADRIVIAGDAKHPIVGTPPPLRPVVFAFFGRLLQEDLDVELVPGNHDVGLTRYLPREVVVHGAVGIAREGVGIFHGHRWPSPEVLRCEQLVAGHLHPGVRFAPTRRDPLAKRRCWVRVEFSATHPLPARRRRDPPIGARELIVLPALNPIAGTEALNRDRPTRGRTFLVKRFLARGTVRAYLLDGTDVGLLPIPRSIDRPCRSSRAARRRR